MSHGPALVMPLRVDGEIAFLSQSGKKNTEVEWKTTSDSKG